MATGTSARSSQPLNPSQLSTPSFPSSRASTPSAGPYIRVKSRRQPTNSSDIEESKEKRLRVEAMESEAWELLRASMKTQAMSESKVGRVRLNTFELATQLLQDEYESRLSESHFLKAIECLESQSKASVFITLKSRIRDQWLLKNAKVEFLNEVYNELNI